MARGHSRIRSAGYHLPEAKVQSGRIEIAFELEEKFGVRVGAIERATGVHTRHLADAGATPSELAYLAARDALERGGVRPEELDVICFAAVSRDYAEPSTAHLIQARLGAANAFVFDISNACLSVVNGILVLDSLIGAGRCRTGLVCGGELSSEVLRATYDKLHAMKPEEEILSLFPVLTLGDAGAALVLEPRGDDAPERGFVAFEFVSKGEHAHLCVLPALKEPMVTDGRRLLDVCTRLGVDAFRRLLEKSRWRAEDVDLLIPHQISLPANMKVLAALGFPPERCHLVIDRFGNTAATTVPLALAHASETGRLRPGMKVVLAGFGSGVSVGFASLVW